MTSSRVFPLLVFLAACKDAPAPEDVARERVRAHYDILWRHITGRGAVPETDEELREAAQIDRPDPWGNPYEIEAEGVIRVCSNGPDGEPYTDDDICYPPAEDE